MFDNSFRHRFGAAVRPVLPALARTGVTPNQITVVTFTLALAAAASIAIGYPFTGLAIWLVSRVGDGLDGALARQTGRASPFGGYLDITLDMAGYSAMVLGFAVAHPDLWPAWICVLAGYVLAITTTLALSDAGRAAGRPIGLGDRTFQFTPAITEAGETTVIYALWVLFPAYLPWLAWLWVAALAATAVQRTLVAARILR